MEKQVFGWRPATTCPVSPRAPITFEELIEKLKAMIPELLEENGLFAAGTEEVP
jgi:hypothetical protein